MKQTNIPEQQCTVGQMRSFIRWYRVARLTVVGTTFLGICAVLPVIINWIVVRNNRIALQNQLAPFESVVQKKHALKKKEQELKATLAKIEKISSHTPWLYDYVNVLHELLGNDVLFESIMVTKKKFQINCYAVDIAQLMAFINRIVESSLFKQVLVQSISQQSQEKPRFMATITGMIA